jgi:hypothetical protein
MATADKPKIDEPPYAANAVRLSPRLWIVTLIILLVVTTALPAIWARVEPLPKSANNRVPFRLSNDYWMFSRYAKEAVESHTTLLLGDSVVWGHYVSPNGTLSAQLNRIRTRREFLNLGVDGIHPAALAGLLECYGDRIAGQRVVLHCNLLWMSSPQHDLTSSKEFVFNHPNLVPQFYPSIPCYREPLSGRLSIIVNRNSRFLSWTRHLQIAYLDGNDWATWSLDHPYADPLRQLALDLPGPDEPPNPAPSQESWTKQGIRPVNFRWVDFSKSYQWQSFRRVVSILQKRGNAVFVMVGPFNEHMLQPQSLDAYRARKEIVARWLDEQQIPHLVVDVLPSETYADASHPLDEGYREWAKQLLADRTFLDFAR